MSEFVVSVPAKTWTRFQVTAATKAEATRRVLDWYEGGEQVEDEDFSIYQDAGMENYRYSTRSWEVEDVTPAVEWLNEAASRQGSSPAPHDPA